MLSNDITNRTTTPTGLSIGTGLAVESVLDVPLFDKDRNIPNKVSAEDYKLHIFNVFTLFRNVINSIPYKDKDVLIASKPVQEQLLNDMYILIELYEAHGVKLAFYRPDYTNVYKKYSKGKDTSVYPPYILYKYMLRCIKSLKLPGNIITGGVNARLTSTTDRVVLLTHFVTDLLNIDIIPNLDLLESHTGVIKTKLNWGKKYHPVGKRDLSILPINARILYILGDKALIKPVHIARRKELYELAVKNKWTPAKTALSVNSSIKKLNNSIPV